MAMFAQLQLNILDSLGWKNFKPGPILLSSEEILLPGTKGAQLQ